ncbi:hypothetical protein FKP32DRAFT_1589354 [Trametes sanguinea]|nr:hypothetical protein FKP32DRAFT_1589354 [Trametes sanguinea]
MHAKGPFAVRRHMLLAQLSDKVSRERRVSRIIASYRVGAPIVASGHTRLCTRICQTMPRWRDDLCGWLERCPRCCERYGTSVFVGTSYAGRSIQGVFRCNYTRAHVDGSLNLRSSPLVIESSDHTSAYSKGCRARTPRRAEEGLSHTCIAVIACSSRRRTPDSLAIIIGDFMPSLLRTLKPDRKERRRMQMSRHMDACAPSLPYVLEGDASLRRRSSRGYVGASARQSRRFERAGRGRCSPAGPAGGRAGATAGILRSCNDMRGCSRRE